MAVSSADVRAIVERVCARPDVMDACARRDLGAVISALGSFGVTQGQISALTGVPEEAIYDITINPSNLPKADTSPRT